MSRKFQESHLVPRSLPRLDGIVEKLESSVHVADVGCGATTPTVTMANAFPNSRFSGSDISLHALNRARLNVDAVGAKNTHLHNAIDHPLPEDGSLDLVTTFDVIHDSTHPEGLIDAIRRSLKPDGICLCADIQGKLTFAENKSDRPIATIAYSFSVLVCM